MKRIAIFTGTAHPMLAEAMVASTKGELTLGKATIKRFSDGEIVAQIEQNVRRMDTYVIQPTCSPTNDNLMELLIMMDALRRASSRSITAVIPYYGYSRQERKSAPRTPISAKLVTDMIVSAGADRIVAVDLHATQIQGFTNKPFDNLFAKSEVIPYLVNNYTGCAVITPDAGGFERARSYSKLIPGSHVVAIDKRREKANVSEVMNVIGEVEGFDCIIVDDMIDTAGTLCGAAKALMDRGAKSVSATATHAVLSGPAVGRIIESPLREVIITDTIPLSDIAVASGKFKVVSIAPMLANAIRRIHSGDSVSSLFI